MDKIFQNIELKLITKTIILLILLNFNIYSSDNDSEDDTSDSRKLTLRIYLLHPNTNIENALKEKDSSNEIIDYKPYDCKINQGCCWYSKPKSRTIPKFWELVRQGSGVDLKQIDDENIFEHWLYYVHSNGNKFGVVFGNGEFFKTEKHEFFEEGELFKYRGIRKEYGDPSFGYKVVRDLVKLPKRRAKRGTIEGKPYNNFCSTISGLDFCSVSLLHNLDQIPSLCNYLWRYAQRNSYQLLRAINEKAKECDKEVYDVTAEVQKAVIGKTSKEEDSEDEEGQEIEYIVGKEKKVATKAYGRYWTYEGLREYSQHTTEEVEKLIQNEIITLPDFNAQALKAKTKLPLKIKEPLEAMDIEEGPKSFSKPKEPRIDYEGIYNAYVAEIQTLKLLDKKCVENVEVCDLLDEEKRILIHVKIGTDSAILNHLFGQGLASATLLQKQEYRKKIPFDIARKKICQFCKQITKDKYQIKKDEIENSFLIWKEEYKSIIIKESISLKQNERNKGLLTILEKITPLTERKEAIESLKAFGDQIDEKNKKTFEKLIERFSDEHLSLEQFKDLIQKEKKSIEEKLYNTLSCSEKFIFDYNDFSEINKNSNNLHITLKKVYKKYEFRNDKILKKIIDLLDPYRFDLIKNSINECCNKEQTRSSKSYKEFCESILLEYKAKRFSRDDLETILKSQNIEAEFNKLHTTFNGINNDSDAKVFSIVYAIITPKLSKDRDLLPLGARINLLSNVQVLTAKTEDKDKGIKFEVALKIVPDVSDKVSSASISKRKRSQLLKQNSKEKGKEDTLMQEASSNNLETTSHLAKKKQKTSTEEISSVSKGVNDHA